MTSYYYTPNLSEKQVEKVCEQTHSFWGGETSLKQRTQSTLQQLKKAGPSLLTYTGLCDQEGIPVASLKRYKLLLCIPGKTLRIKTALGIGAVFTPLAHRKKGLASRLIHDVLTEAKANGVSASVLFTDIPAEFYERLGFSLCASSSDFYLSTENISLENPLMTKPASSSEEADLLRWYHQSYPKNVLHMARNPALWRFFRERNTQNADLLLYEGEKIFGYLHVVYEKKMLWVEEYAAPKVPKERIWATLGVLAKQANLTKIAGWFPAYEVDQNFLAKPRTKALPMIADLQNCLTEWRQGEQLAHFWSSEHF